jgi:hypothetical protein
MFLPLVGFEPTISVFELAKTVHVLNRAATVIGHHFFYLHVKKRNVNVIREVPK